jgi:hypothetical protein
MKIHLKGISGAIAAPGRPKQERAPSGGWTAYSQDEGQS